MPVRAKTPKSRARLEADASCDGLHRGCYRASEKLGNAPACVDGLDHHDDGRFGFLAALAWEFKQAERQGPSRVAAMLSFSCLYNCTQSSRGLLIKTGQTQLNKGNRACSGDRREDVFSESLVPKFIHWATHANKHQTPDIQAKLNQHRAQAHPKITSDPVRAMKHGKRHPAQ